MLLDGFLVEALIDQEADFLNNEILIHRKTTAHYTSDYGQVLYRQDGLIEKVYTSNIEPLHAELEHFVHCVRGGDQPSVGGEQALKALRLASLIEQMAMDCQVWELDSNDANKTENMKLLLQ